MTVPDKRKNNRMIQSGTIMVSDETTDYYTYAHIGNMHGDGIYFESDHPLMPGRTIKIRYDNPPYSSLPRDYHAIVQWCRRLSNRESSLSFGIGAKFL